MSGERNRSGNGLETRLSELFSRPFSRRRLLQLTGETIFVLAVGTACKIVDKPSETANPTAIDLGNFPYECPPAVASVSAAVLDMEVRVRNYMNTGSGLTVRFTGTMVESSNSALKNKLVLTVGHGVRDSEQNNIPFDIYSATAVGRDPQTGTVRKGQGVKTASDLGPYLDYCLMQLDTPLEGLPQTKLGSEPKRGDKVFLLDYAPDGDNSAIKRSPSSPDYAYQTPARYGGVVIGTVQDIDNPDAEYKVVYTFRNLGERDAEEEVRPQASGGPVFDEKGNQVGIIKAMMSNGDQPFTTEQIEELFKIKFNNMTPEDRAKRRHLAFIKVVTSKERQDYETRLAQTPASSPGCWQ